MKIIPISRTIKWIAPFVALAALAGCDATDTRGGALEEPNRILVRSTETGNLTGHYNPAGFVTSEVKDTIRHVCSGAKLASFGEVSKDGLIAFSATCADEPLEVDTRFIIRRHVGAPIESDKFPTVKEGDLIVIYVSRDTNGNILINEKVIGKNA